MRLDAKIAVITGAASGIGLAMAKRFAAEGASVVAGDRNGGRLEEAVEAITAAGGKVVGEQGDISREADAEHLVGLAIERFGGLDVVVNNAGIMDHMAGPGAVTTEMWREVLAVNLDGPMFTTRRAVRYWLDEGRGGSIINIASTAALSGGAAGTAYTTSKHALIGLSRSTAWMHAAEGIRCNVICPGATDTNIAETMPAELLDPVGAARAGVFATLIPAVLQPDDIANLALFLASDESSLISGSIITADGGWKAV